MTLSTAIAGGLYDDDLDEIIRSVKFRKDTIARAMVNTLSPGDTVVIKDCSPKLLIGKRATIEYVAGDKIQVRLPILNNKKWSNASVGVKANMIQKVEV